jgi:hypothetical protein
LAIPHVLSNRRLRNYASHIEFLPESICTGNMTFYEIINLKRKGGAELKEGLLLTAFLLLFFTGWPFALKHLGATTTSHGSTGFVAHSGEAVFGSSLSSLTVADKHSRC